MSLTKRTKTVIQKEVKPLYLCSKERYGVSAGSIVGCIRDGSILVAVFQV